MISPAFRFFHDQLPDDRLRDYYDAVERGVRVRMPFIMHPEIAGIRPELYFRILEHVYDDHPEFFSFYPLKSKAFLTGGSVYIHPFYRYSRERQLEYEAALERTVQRILAECFPKGWDAVSELAREKQIFDWITRNVKYDYESRRVANTGQSSEAESAAWNAYGALVLGEAVCEGIACAFKLLCDRVGLPSIVALGRAGAGERHAWNLVRINKKFYQVDCTWDLRSELSAEVPFARYRYFNLPDAVIGVNHTPEAGFLPKCGSLQYNPFRLRGLCALRPEELWPMAKKQLDSGVRRFALMTYGFRAAEAEALALARQMNGYLNKNVTYYLDDSGHFLGFVVA